MASDTIMILCCRSDSAGSVAVGSLPGKCSICGTGVWLAPSSIRLLRTEGAKVACLDCGLPLAASEAGEMGFPPGQLEELAAAGVTPADMYRAISALANAHRSDKPTWKKA